MVLTTHYLGSLIENALRLRVDIKAMLLDRGFNSVAIILELESHGVQYIMLLRGNDRLGNIIREVDAGASPCASTP